jgi:sugar O-acyltransferase (sialic acid O-acetyltransferase NeuD family)
LPFGNIAYFDEELLQSNKYVDAVMGVGYPTLLRSISERFKNTKFNFVNLIHPSLEIDSDYINYGIGNIFSKGVTATCDITIGNFNLFNNNVSIGHDSKIGSFNVINPCASISGGVIIGDGCLIGTGARILEGLVIGSNITIGAGAVVVKSIEKPGTYVGMPARLKSE